MFFKLFSCEMGEFRLFVLEGGSVLMEVEVSDFLGISTTISAEVLLAFGGDVAGGGDVAVEVVVFFFFLHEPLDFSKEFLFFFL